MQRVIFLALAVGCFVAEAGRSAEAANPLQKAIELLTNLQAEVIREGEAYQMQYEEFSKWCSKTALELKHELSDGLGSKDDLQASIAKCNADIDNLSAEVSSLSGQIATDESDLKAAMLIRQKESSDFKAGDKELSDTIDTLTRAIAVLKKSAASGASFLQRNGAQLPSALAAVASALGELVQAESIFSAKDTASLAAILEAREDDDDDGKDSTQDDDSGQVAGEDVSLVEQGSDISDSKKSSGGILEVLESMLEKATAAQSKTRGDEVNSKHNFELLKLSLEDKLSTGKGELDKVKKELASTGETRASAEGDLETTQKAIAATKQQLANAQQECMERAEAFSTEVTARKEELTALATAKKMVQGVSGLQTASSSSGEDSEADSFVQVAAHQRFASGVGTSALDAFQRVTSLARKAKSRALAQLASRIRSAIKIEQSGLATGAGDPFRKVKSMIGDMIEKLMKEAENEAGQKQFCDREMSRSEAAIDKKGDDVDDLDTKIDTVGSKKAKLEEEVATLSGELGSISASQKEMSKMRNEDEAEFKIVVTDLTNGIAAVQGALKVLRDYYAKGDSLLQTGAQDRADAASGDGGTGSAGGASGIIGLLEVVESDFTKSLAEVKSEEEVKKDEYEKTMQELKVVQAQKRRDEYHKSAEIKQLDKTAAELGNDKQAVQQELDAVNEYYGKLKPQCTSAPVSYEERKKRRDSIIAGLKEALETLNAEDN